MLLDQLKKTAADLRVLAESLPGDQPVLPVVQEPLVTKVAMPQADTRQILNFVKFFGSGL